jgi:hypothetical protein
VLLGAEGERVDVDTSVWVACVVLVRLNKVEVCTFAFREAVLSVKLKLGGNNRVLSPAVKRESSFSEHKGTGIRDTRVTLGTDWESIRHSRGGVSPLVGGCCEVIGTWVLEHTIAGVNESTIAIDGSLAGESSDGWNKGIKGIGVVERLGTKSGVQSFSTNERRAVVYIFVWLDNEDKFLAWVVEIELNLVGRRTNGFISSELKLFNKVLMWVLGHTSAFIRIKENVVNVKRSGNKRLLV